MTRLLLPWVLLTLVACGARVDPLADQRRALARVATAPVEEDLPHHLSMRLSSQVLEELLFLAMEHGEDGQGLVAFPTPAGEARLRITPGDVREPLQLGRARCEDCVRLQGTVTGTVEASIGSVNVNTRAGVHTDVPVQISARTKDRGSEIVVTPRWDRQTSFEVQLLGLPLGGMGINRSLTSGLRQELDGREFLAATLPASGPLPIRGVQVEPGGVVHTSLRVNGASEAPSPPDSLEEGVWVGLSTQTLRAWFEAYLIRRMNGRWSASPSAITADDNRITATLDVWRVKRKPKLRQYTIGFQLVRSGARWTIVDFGVERAGRHGFDPVGGIIRNKIEGRVGRERLKAQPSTMLCYWIMVDLRCWQAIIDQCCVVYAAVRV